MFKRIFVLLFILLLSSIVWFPGLSKDSTFNHHSELQIFDTEDRLSGFLDRTGLSLTTLRDRVTSGFDYLLAGKMLPEAQLDSRHDRPMENFFSRVWGSPYFAAMRAMLELSVVRAILALIWFAALCPILMAVVLDAWVVRRLKYESFAAVHPTLYQSAVSAPPVLLTTAFIVMMFPGTIPIWIATLFYIAFLISIHIIVSNFHRFG